MRVEASSRSQIRRFLLVMVMAGILCMSQNVFATTVDLVNTDSGILNGAIFTRIDQSPAGSGVIDSFLRIQQNVYEQGYNTDGRDLQYDENSSPTFTRSLSLSAVPIVNIGGVNYREFLLDINQVNSDAILTLDRVVVSLRSAGDLLGGTVAHGGHLGADANALFTDDTLVYDSGAANQVQLDYALQSGSGQSDMFLYIPVNLFTGPNTFVYLYAEFGLETGTECPNDPTALQLQTCFADSNDGYEEWAVRIPGPPQQVPEPTSLVLLGVGLFGVAIARRNGSTKA